MYNWNLVKIINLRTSKKSKEAFSHSFGFQTYQPCPQLRGMFQREEQGDVETALGDSKLP